MGISSKGNGGNPLVGIIINGGIWGQWVTAEAGAAIRAALAAGEFAEGWPDE